MIEFMNAISVQVVMFVGVLAGAACILVAWVVMGRNSKRDADYKHRETMVTIETKHREVMSLAKPKELTAVAHRQSDD